MQCVHIGMECYPAAKVGGLGDVMGALPKYLNAHGVQGMVVIPHFHRPWFKQQTFESVSHGKISLPNLVFNYEIKRLTSLDLGYVLHTVNIPGRLDRPGVYADSYSGDPYWDEFERYLSFQIAALTWINEWQELPSIIHCHDHHTGIIPFLMKHGKDFKRLKDIPSVVTIHNGEYHGRYTFSKTQFLPSFDWTKIGLLDWNGELNALAAAIKTAWKVTTVSPNYMQELQYHSAGIEPLMVKEEEKCIGILNGIDTEFWNPETDTLIPHTYNVESVLTGKAQNKTALLERFGLEPNENMTVCFIGRLVGEKGADLLPDLFMRFLDIGEPINFLLLGTGDRKLHARFEEMNQKYHGKFKAILEYNEGLAHLLYSGSDFILMPSRVEPCGLNQLYAMRYGTLPIVRAVGGLKDTVPDISSPNGRGLRFYNFTLEESAEALQRAHHLYTDKKKLHSYVKRIMQEDFSWHKSAGEYKELYTQLINPS